MVHSFSKALHALIEQHGATRAKRNETRVCTGWILVTEWVNGDGNVWLEESRLLEMPTWRRNGILYYVLEQEGSVPEDE